MAVSGVDQATLLHHGGPAGQWASLGQWPARGEPEMAYAQACAAQARTLAQAAALPAGASVLAPGCGAGEELRLWREEFGASLVVGLEPDASRRAAAAAAGIAPAPGIELRPGSAATMHSLGPERFDAVLANDCAYHFGPRGHWLPAAAAVLRPGGRIAFCDLVLEPHGPVRGLAARALAAALRHRAIDIAELRSEASIRQALTAAGFADVRVQRLDDAVLGGFVRFVARQGARIGRDARQTPAWHRVAMTARALPVCRALGLGYAVFSATRTGPAPAAVAPQR